MLALSAFSLTTEPDNKWFLFPLRGIAYLLWALQSNSSQPPYLISNFTVDQPFASNCFTLSTSIIQTVSLDFLPHVQQHFLFLVFLVSRTLPHNIFTTKCLHNIFMMNTLFKVFIPPPPSLLFYPLVTIWHLFTAPSVKNTSISFSPSFSPSCFVLTFSFQFTFQPSGTSFCESLIWVFNAPSLALSQCILRCYTLEISADTDIHKLTIMIDIYLNINSYIY